MLFRAARLPASIMIPPGILQRSILKFRLLYYTSEYKQAGIRALQGIAYVALVRLLTGLSLPGAADAAAPTADRTRSSMIAATSSADFLPSS